MAEHKKASQFGGVYFTAGGLAWLGSALVDEQTDTLVLFGAVALAAGATDPAVNHGRNHR